MSKLKKDRTRFKRRRNRSKSEMYSQGGRYRLCVYRSNKHIEAQIIDDIEGKTLISSSSKDKAILKIVKEDIGKMECSKVVGNILAEGAIKLKIKKVAFDRNGYPYHGRIKAMADAARESGLDF